MRKRSINPNRIDVLRFLAVSILIAGLFGQTFGGTISGRVLDAQSQPVSGVTVNLKAYNLQTTTNSLGQFSLVVPTTAAFLPQTSLSQVRENAQAEIFDMQGRRIGSTPIQKMSNGMYLLKIQKGRETFMQPVMFFNNTIFSKGGSLK